MPIYLKKSDGNWSTNAKKVFVKAADGLWKSATRLFAKTNFGWVQMWPGDAPAVNANDPLNIRSGGYNGTVVPSPQYLDAVLYGHDGNGSSITGAQPITFNYRKMKVSYDDTGNEDRVTLESIDVYNLTSGTESNVAYKRYWADAFYLFYEVKVTNVWGSSVLYSNPPIKLIRKSPVINSSSWIESPTQFTFNFNIEDRWYNAVDWSRSYVKWWQNTSKTPGGTALRTDYLDSITVVTETRSGSYEDYNGTGTTYDASVNYNLASALPAGQYIVAQLYLQNSYTDHYGSPVTLVKSSGDVPVITNVNFTDENGNLIVDNQSSPRIITDGYIWITATVNNALSSTYYLLEPKMYNRQSGNYYKWNSTTVTDSATWSDDLTPWSVTLNGTTATVVWRTYINADILYGIAGPTYNTGQARWEYLFRLSARASSTTSNANASYYDGVVNLGAIQTYQYGRDLPGTVIVAPSSAMTLNVSSTSISPGSSVTFSGSTVSYPSGYASYPRRYIIEYGDETDSGWQYFSTGTSNPSFANITKTYSSGGTYTAILKWEPQGDPTRSTRSRQISVVSNKTAPTITSVVAGLVGGTVTCNFSGGSGPYYQIYWFTSNTAPTFAVTPDGSGSSSPISDTTGPTSTTTQYMYVRSVETAGETSVGPSSLASAWSAGVAFNMTSSTTYGPCEVWYTSTTYECDAQFNRDVTTTYYRRKIYVNGVWDGSSYDTSGCTNSVTYGSYQLTDGRCGWTAPTYKWYCHVNYYQSGLPDEYYESTTDDSEVVCNSYRTVCSYNNTGSYPASSNPPACTTTTTTTTVCTCVYSDYGTYYFAPQCCPSGSPRSGALSGTTSGSCCPDVYKTTTTTTTTTTTASLVYWKCNQTDVNTASNPCYFVGQCKYEGNTYYAPGCVPN